MTIGFVEHEIQRNNRNLIVLSLFFLVAIAIIAGLNIRYLYNFVLGPFETQPAEILTLGVGAKPLEYYITITGDDFADTGFDWISESDSGQQTVEATYLALFLNERILLVKSATTFDESTPTFTGKITPMPDDVRDEIIAVLESDYPEIQGAFLPFILDTAPFRKDGYIGLALCGIFALLAFLGVGKAVFQMDITRHPFLKSLERFGSPEFTASRINMEMAGDHPKFGQIHLSQNWIMQSALWSMKATRMEDVIWGYKLVTQHRTYGIPTGKSYSGLLFDRHGTQFTYNGKQADIDRFLSEVNQRAPWMITGYSPDLAQAWQRDRQGLIAAVDARRMGNQ